jgi:HlyD family secretion protein
MKRWLPWIIGLLIVAAAVVFGVRKYMTASKAPPQYETVKVDRGSVVARVTATGTLSALVTVEVGSQVSGRIKELHADFNSPVTKGQLLAKLDPQLFQASMASAQANLTAAKGNQARAQAQAEIARIQYERSKQLAEKNLIAQSELDTARAQMLTSQAEVQVTQGSVAQANAQVKQASINLAFASVYSPVDGIVISRSVDVGQTVAASLQAPVLFTIAEDMRKMQVNTSVAEADVGKLEAGMATSFTVDAFPGTKFKGKVRQIRNAPVTVQNVVTYDAVIDVDNPELKLKPGMTATVTFVYAERQDTLRVTNAALRFKPPADATGSASGAGSAGPPRRRRPDGAGGEGGPPSDRKVLWALRDGTLHRVPVKVGLSDGSMTEIVEGDLKEGELVVTGSPSPGGAPASTPPGGGRGMGRIL